MAKALELIEPHPTWDVIDSSKLSCYMACPRKYFFQYVLGWKPDYPNNHLVFGTAWHLAVEHLLVNNYTQESLEEAQFLFLSRYRQDLDASTDEDMGPKHPENALRALQAYVQRFRTDILQYQVLHTEIAGLVLVAPGATMHFKIDALLSEQEMYNERRKKYLFIDHKTSQRKYSNWGDHWTLSTQMLLYYHVLNCLYPREEIGDARVRCTFFYKPPRPAEFAEHNITKTAAQMQAWLERTSHWYQSLQYDMEVLEEDTTDSIVMRSFPQNDLACHMYGIQCTYFDYCCTYSNPLIMVDRGTPLGFRREFWDPRTDESIRKRVGTVGTLGA